MHKNKVGLVLALGLAFSPALAFGMESAPVYGNTKMNMDARVNSNMVLPLQKNDTSAGIRAGAKIDLQAGVNGEKEKPNEARAEHLQAMMNLLASDDAKIEASAGARKKEILDTLLKLKARLKTKLNADAQGRVKIALGEIFRAFENKIDMLTKVDARIAAKITLLANTGTDVTAMQTAYASAHTLLAKAKVDVAATQTVAIDQTSTQTSKDAFRALIKTAQDSIKAAGEAYRKVLPLIPGASANTNVETESSISNQ